MTFGMTGRSEELLELLRTIHVINFVSWFLFVKIDKGPSIYDPTWRIILMFACEYVIYWTLDISCMVVVVVFLSWMSHFLCTFSDHLHNILFFLKSSIYYMGHGCGTRHVASFSHTTILYGSARQRISEYTVSFPSKPSKSQPFTNYVFWNEHRDGHSVRTSPH